MIASTSTTASSVAPTLRLLSEEELAEALVGLQNLPPGYSQNAPSEKVANKTFCDYVPPFEEGIKVTRDFTKGIGLSAEMLGVGLRQFASANQAREAFEALTDTLEFCTSDTRDGVEVTYSQVSAPKVGDGSVGVRITDPDASVIQFFALVGPVLVNTGGGGLVNVDVDEVMSLLEAQVDKYAAAAAT